VILVAVVSAILAKERGRGETKDGVTEFLTMFLREHPIKLKRSA